MIMRRPLCGFSSATMSATLHARRAGCPRRQVSCQITDTAFHGSQCSEVQDAAVASPETARVPARWAGSPRPRASPAHQRARLPRRTGPRGRRHPRRPVASSRPATSLHLADPPCRWRTGGRPRRENGAACCRRWLELATSTRRLHTASPTGSRVVITAGIWWFAISAAADAHTSRQRRPCVHDA